MIWLIFYVILGIVAVTWSRRRHGPAWTLMMYLGYVAVWPLFAVVEILSIEV
jgi:hypothetical protein